MGSTQLLRWFETAGGEREKETGARKREREGEKNRKEKKKREIKITDEKLGDICSKDVIYIFFLCYFYVYAYITIVF